MTIVWWEAKEYEEMWANDNELNPEQARTPMSACLRRMEETLESRHLRFLERLLTVQILVGTCRV